VVVLIVLVCGIQWCDRLVAWLDHRG
ncbi:ABC transporter permease, partial [Mesorhizobium sp. M1A.F.Ca.ET.072.01.1.1]